MQCHHNNLFHQAFIQSFKNNMEKPEYKHIYEALKYNMEKWQWRTKHGYEEFNYKIQA
jgi:hypothetical protein